MKKILFIFAFFVANFSIAQKLSEIDTLNYEQMSDKENSKNYKNGMDIKVYVASDKNSYKVGDTIILGNPTGEGQSAFSKKRNFEYLFYGKPAGVLLKGVRKIEEQYKDYKLTIEKIQLNKGLGLENYVFFYVKPLKNSDFTVLDTYITVTMVDNAITKGEIRPLKSTRPMTREEAVELLKKKKEELDLEIITKEEFDKIREQLTPIIKTGK